MFVYVSFGRLFCNAWLNAHNTGNECKFMAIFLLCFLVHVGCYSSNGAHAFIFFCNVHFNHLHVASIIVGTVLVVCVTE